MAQDQQEWSFAQKEMIDSLMALGYPRELGDEIAKNLGSQGQHRPSGAETGVLQK